MRGPNGDAVKTGDPGKAAENPLEILFPNTTDPGTDNQVIPWAGMYGNGVPLSRHAGTHEASITKSLRPPFSTTTFLLFFILSKKSAILFQKRYHFLHSLAFLQ
jgi:hypothetical protein